MDSEALKSILQWSLKQHDPTGGLSPSMDPEVHFLLDALLKASNSLWSCNAAFEAIGLVELQPLLLILSYILLRLPQTVVR